MVTPVTVGVIITENMFEFPTQDEEALILTTGEAPTKTCAVNVSVHPLSVVTRSFVVYVPAAENVFVGFCTLESVVPSCVKSQPQLLITPEFAVL